MKYYYLDGFVIHRIALGEADKIITFFSKEKGKVRVVAKGVRKAKAKLAGHLEPFNEIKLRLTKGKNLDIIIGAETINSYSTGSSIPELLEAIYYMNELVSKLVADEQVNAKLYSLYIECLNGAINQKIKPAVVKHYFGLRFLQASGLQPNLSEAKINTHNYFIYDNSTVVSSRPNSHYGVISIDTIKLWRLIENNPLKQIGNISGLQTALQEGGRLLNNYYEYHFDFISKSLKVFQD